MSLTRGVVRWKCHPGAATAEPHSRRAEQAYASMPPKLLPHQIEAEVEKEARADAERNAAVKAAKSPCTVLEGIRRKYKYKKPGEDGEEVDVEADLADERILAHTGAKQELHLLTRVFMPDENVVSVGERASSLRRVAPSRSSTWRATACRRGRRS